MPYLMIICLTLLLASCEDGSLESEGSAEIEDFEEDRDSDLWCPVEDDLIVSTQHINWSLPTLSHMEHSFFVL